MRYITFIIVWAVIATVAGVFLNNAEAYTSYYDGWRIYRNYCIPAPKHQTPTCLIERWEVKK